MKKATATSQGSTCFADSPGRAGATGTALELAGIILGADGVAELRSLVYHKRTGQLGMAE
jgi:hypothetical protein